MQQCAAAHRNLAAQEFVAEQSRHRPAQQQILFDVALVRPRHVHLMGDAIATSEWIHDSKFPELSLTRQRWFHGASVWRFEVVASGIGRRRVGSQLSITVASLA